MPLVMVSTAPHKLLHRSHVIGCNLLEMQCWLLVDSAQPAA